MTRPVRGNEATQQDGLNSRIYVPILLEIVRRKHEPGATEIRFTKGELEQVAADLGLRIANAADLVYRMRSRTKLPEALLDLGFTILRSTGRGQYVLQKGAAVVVSLPSHQIQDAIDQTPLPVRRLLPLNIAEIDEQGLLTLIGYCGLLNHFTGLSVYRLRSHVRRSVPDIGQAELDEVDVGVAFRDDEVPIVIPIEAKATDEVINSVQVATMVAYCQTYFPGHTIRPIVVKLTYDAVIHFIEFPPVQDLALLTPLASAGYRLNLSEAQRELISASKVPA